MKIDDLEKSFTEIPISLIETITLVALNSEISPIDNALSLHLERSAKMILYWPPLTSKQSLPAFVTKRLSIDNVEKSRSRPSENAFLI